MLMSPSVAPADVAGVNALIALITDAKAAGKRLAELQAATNAANAAADKAREIESVAVAARKDASRIADEAAADSAAALAKAAEDRGIAEKALSEANVKSQRAETKMREIQTREDALEAYRADAEAALSKRVDDVTEREAAIEAREQISDAKATAADRKAADYESRIAALKKLAE